MDMTIAPDAAPDDGIAQQIADAAKALPVDDLTTLMHGISPEALEVMEKIPDLAAFANFIENGGSSDAPDADDQSATPDGKPAVAIIATPAKPANPRDDIRRSMAQHGIRA